MASKSLHTTFTERGAEGKEWQKPVFVVVACALPWRSTAVLKYNSRYDCRNRFFPSEYSKTPGILGTVRLEHDSTQGHDTRNSRKCTLQPTPGWTGTTNEKVRIPGIQQHWGDDANIISRSTVL